MLMTRDQGLRRVAWAAGVLAMLALPSAFASRAIAGGCTEDAAGICERPIACNPPVGGKCTTVTIPQPLTGHKFECKCLVPPPPPAPKTSVVPQAGAAGATSPAALEADQASARKAQAAIQASKQDQRQLAAAVRAHNQAAARELLLRRGFTAQQLQGATIVLVDKTGAGGGHAERLKVTIVVTCCPLTITITINL